MTTTAETDRGNSTTTTGPAPFTVEGVDADDGTYTLLYSAETSAECRAWLAAYIYRPDRDAPTCGGWSLIEIYDCRADCERIAFWEAPDAD